MNIIGVKKWDIYSDCGLENEAVTVVETNTCKMDNGISKLDRYRYSESSSRSYEPFGIHFNNDPVRVILKR